MVEVLHIYNFYKADNELAIEFKLEDIYSVLNAVIKYICKADLSYFYFYFEGEFSSFDKTLYYEKYPKFANDREGIIEIKKEEFLDPVFVADILIDCNMSSLYIERTEQDIQNRRCIDLQSGYEIRLTENYIYLRRSYDMPEWDITEIGLVLPPSPSIGQGVKNRIEVLHTKMSNRFLYIEFNEEDLILVIDNILQYMCYSKPLFFYLYYNDSSYSFNKFYHTERYPKLARGKKGIVEIREEEALDPLFIADILPHLRWCAFYINQKDNVKSLDSLISNQDRLLTGYRINEIRDNFISLERTNEMPEWDLEKMGICSIKNR